VDHQCGFQCNRSTTDLPFGAGLVVGKEKKNRVRQSASYFLTS